MRVPFIASPLSWLNALSWLSLGLCLIGLFDATGVMADEEEVSAQGKLHHGLWRGEAYPGTVRDYWVYVPAAYRPDQPASLMVFNDGKSYHSEQGAFRVPQVIDGLINEGAMPVTLAVFINPGGAFNCPWSRLPKNRSFEYDALGDRYARFLIERFLPPIEAQYNLSKSPEDRAICGISSGGIGAFTVAWERPDVFGKVLCHIGSFVNIRGGHAYPFLIRKTEKKPIKIFLQEGRRDLDNLHGNWPLANREMVAALEYKGYDYQFVMGDGATVASMGGQILADSLRWLWKEDQP